MILNEVFLRDDTSVYVCGEGSWSGVLPAAERSPGWLPESCCGGECGPPPPPQDLRGCLFPGSDGACQVRPDVIQEHVPFPSWAP